MLAPDNQPPMIDQHRVSTAYDSSTYGIRIWYFKSIKLRNTAWMTFENVSMNHDIELRQIRQFKQYQRIDTSCHDSSISYYIRYWYMKCDVSIYRSFCSRCVSINGIIKHIFIWRLWVWGQSYVYLNTI